MAQYISKSALVAEIERRKHKLLDNIICEGDKEWVVRTAHQLNRILLFLDTLEVKEVDLDNEYIEEVYSHLDTVSGKLKAAAEEYSFNVPTQCYADIVWKNETEKHFIDGANWQKAQLLAGDAIKEVKGSFGGEIKVDLYAKLDNGGYIDFDPSMKLNPACGVKIGNRVRIIVMED